MTSEIKEGVVALGSFLLSRLDSGLFVKSKVVSNKYLESDRIKVSSFHHNQFVEFDNCLPIQRESCSVDQ